MESCKCVTCDADSSRVKKSPNVWVYVCPQCRQFSFSIQTASGEKNEKLHLLFENGAVVVLNNKDGKYTLDYEEENKSEEENKALKETSERKPLREETLIIEETLAILERYKKTEEELQKKAKEERLKKAEEEQRKRTEAESKRKAEEDRYEKIKEELRKEFEEHLKKAEEEYRKESSAVEKHHRKAEEERCKKVAEEERKKATIVIKEIRRKNEELRREKIAIENGWRKATEDLFSTVGLGASVKEIKHLLIQKGVDINGTDGNGQTPLILAAKGKDSEILLFLINNGAHIGIKDKYGKRAIDYAEENEALKETSAYDLLQEKMTPILEKDRRSRIEKEFLRINEELKKTSAYNPLLPEKTKIYRRSREKVTPKRDYFRYDAREEGDII